MSREIGAFVNSTFRVKIGIKSPQAYNREQFQIGQGGYNIKETMRYRNTVGRSGGRKDVQREKQYTPSHNHSLRRGDAVYEGCIIRFIQLFFM